MQSKTSFFNRTVFRKDITRFSPIWGLYTLALLLGLVLSYSNMSDYDLEFYLVDSMADFIMLAAVINCGYALLNAQALFGDLYNSRSCYALHAMPLRRESWYVTHVVSGLLFSLVPSLLMALCAIPMVASSCVVGAWKIPLYVLLAASLQYIFFFGVAVLATFCAGNRLGMVVLYAGVNLGAAVTGLLVEAIYIPLLFGVRLATQRYLPYSPMAQMTQIPLMEFEDFWDLRRIWEEAGEVGKLEVNFSLIGGTWGYYAICAALGLALILLGLWLYKKRKLECAGDFLAFKCLQPVFLALFTFGMGAGFQLIFASYSTEDNIGWFAFLIVGMVVGWFGGKMLLERSMRVFRKRNVPGLVLISLVVGLSLGLTWLDPLDIENWIPEPEEVASVQVGEYNYYTFEATNPEDIEKLMTLHALALEEHLDWETVRALRASDVDIDSDDQRRVANVELCYNMKNGRQIIRHYLIWIDSEAGQIAKKFYSRPEVVLDPRFSIDEATELYIDGMSFEEYTDDLKSLWAAIRADCEEGSMVDSPYYHVGGFRRDVNERYGYTEEHMESNIGLRICSPNADIYLGIYADAANTVKWLTDRGILEELGLTRVETDGPPAVG